MSKLAGNRIESFLKAPDAKIRAVLIYGPDLGLVHERLDRLTATVVPDRADPFRIADLAPQTIRDDPARLADEAAAIALTGGRRVVRLRDATDGIVPALKSFLDHPLGDALILIEAGELGPRSALRKVMEEADNAVALPCYADEGGGLETVINESLRAHGLTAHPDAMGWLVENLGGDRRMTRSEIDKLALYMGGPGRVALEDAMASIGDSSALSLDALIAAVAGGHSSDSQTLFDRLMSEGTQPVQILRALSRHFLKLHPAAAALAAGKSAEQAVAQIKPPPFFRQAEQIRAQIRQWPPGKLAMAIDLLTQAEIDCKTTGMPAQALCGRAILQLARAGGRR